MVHPLVITAAATAGVGAVVAFELAVFKPWREENWPHGFGEGVRTEFLKLRREVEQAVNEIQDDLRTLRDGHRRRGSGGHRRLSDDELDDFRRGVGEEASSESAQHEFEMHERQASAYRERLRALIDESLANSSGREERGLRRRKPNTLEGHTIQIPVVDIRTSPSPEVPHHSLGDVSPSLVDGASLASPFDSRFNSVKSIASEARSPIASFNGTQSEGDEQTNAAKNDLLGLEFSHHEASASAAASQERQPAPANDPFVNIVDGTASSWHAVFSDRASPPQADLDPEGEESHVALDTNGLSQTLSDQHNAQPETCSLSNAPDSPYQSNRALQPVAPGSRSEGSETEPDFEVVSEAGETEGRWLHLDAPPSPTISSGSGHDAGSRGASDVLSLPSDGEDSWAELSDVGSESEGAAHTGSVTRTV